MELRRATTQDVRGLVGVLTRAFDDDPVARYIFPGDRTAIRAATVAHALALLRRSLD